MARKQTPPTVSKIAARVLSDDRPLDGHRDAIAKAIQECGLPLSQRAIDGFVDRIEHALEPMLFDLRALANHALGSVEAPLELTEEAPKELSDPVCTCGESKAACPVHE